MTFKYVAAAAFAVGTALASTQAPAMTAANLTTINPSTIDAVRYCRYRGCGRVYVRRYVPSYGYYGGQSYYVPYGYGYAPSYGAYGYGGPAISFGFGFGRGFGGWGRHRW
jgi:hypothetical protein